MSEFIASRLNSKLTLFFYRTIRENLPTTKKEDSTGRFTPASITNSLCLCSALLVTDCEVIVLRIQGAHHVLVIL